MAKKYTADIVEAKSLIGDGSLITNIKRSSLPVDVEATDNKTSILSASNTLYPNNNAVNDGLAKKAPISGSTSYIQNQNASAQTANIWINGDVIADGNVGIGTTSPVAKIETNVTGNGTALKLTRDGGSNGYLDIDFDGANSNFNSFYDYIFNQQGVERMRITSSGNVGIGTTSPGYKLDVDGTFRSTGSTYLANNGPTSIAGIGGANSVVTQLNLTSVAAGGSYIAATNSFAINVNNTTGVKILSNGNVGIGTTSPTEKLQVEGNIKASENIIIDTFKKIFLASGSATQYIDYRTFATSSSGDLTLSNVGTGGLALKTSNSDRLNILNNGNVGIGNSSPDVKVDIFGEEILLSSDSVASSVLRLSRDVNDPSNIFRKNVSVDFMLSRQQAIANNLPYTRFDLRLSSADSDTPSLDVMSFLYNGNVGIGTTTPDKKLDIRTNGVNDGLKLTTSQPVTFAQIINGNSESFPVGKLNLAYGASRTVHINALSNLMEMSGGYTTGGQVSFRSHITEIMRMTDVGLGIGTTNPTEELEVVGTVKADNFIGNGSAITGLNSENYSFGESYMSNFRSKMLDLGDNYAANSGGYKIGKIKEAGIKPSLHYIPSATNSGVIRAIGKDRNKDLVFARNSTATNVDEDDEIVSAGIDYPRVDFASGKGAFLFELKSTNSLLYSSEIDNAYYLKADCSVLPNTAISLDGVLNADSLIESTTNSNHLINKTSVSSTTTTKTVSVFAKANTRDWVRLQTQSPSTSWVNFNLRTGAVGLTGGGSDSFKIEQYTNGWYRLSVTFTPTNPCGFQFFILDSDRGGSSPSYLGDGVSSVYMWGAQFEEEYYATSYIPTAGTTITRTEDFASKTGLSSYINSQQGTFHFNGSFIDSEYGSARVISLSDGTNDNQISIYNPGNSTSIAFYIALGGTVLLNSNSFQGDIFNSEFSATVTYSNGSTKAYFNGVEIASSTTAAATFGVMDRLNFRNATTAQEFHGYLNELLYCKEILTDAQISKLKGI